jgi:hypothetical protein
MSKHSKLFPLNDVHRQSEPRNTLPSPASNMPCATPRYQKSTTPCAGRSMFVPHGRFPAARPEDPNLIQRDQQRRQPFRQVVVPNRTAASVTTAGICWPKRTAAGGKRLQHRRDWIKRFNAENADMQDVSDEAGCWPCGTLKRRRPQTLTDADLGAFPTLRAGAFAGAPDVIISATGLRQRGRLRGCTCPTCITGLGCRDDEPTRP